MLNVIKLIFQTNIISDFLTQKNVKSVCSKVPLLNIHLEFYDKIIPQKIQMIHELSECSYCINLGMCENSTMSGDVNI